MEYRGCEQCRANKQLEAVWCWWSQRWGWAKSGARKARVHLRTLGRPESPTYYLYAALLCFNPMRRMKVSASADHDSWADTECRNASWHRLQVTHNHVPGKVEMWGRLLKGGFFFLCLNMFPTCIIDQCGGWASCAGRCQVEAQQDKTCPSRLWHCGCMAEHCCPMVPCRSPPAVRHSMCFGIFF